MARQKRVGVVWAGPAVVHEQHAVSRVSMKRCDFQGSAAYAMQFYPVCSRYAINA